MAAVEILREAARAAGLEGATDHAASRRSSCRSRRPPRGLVIGISHEGGTPRDERRTGSGPDGRRARPPSSRSAVGSPAGALAEIVVETGELDQGWCHTIGYLSPIVAAAAVGAHLSGRAARRCHGGRPGRRWHTRRPPARSGSPSGLADAAHLLVIASGADRPAGRELVLKVEEASWLPSAYRDLETFLHGHLPATGDGTGLVLILTDRDRRAERLARARQALAAAQGHRPARRRRSWPRRWMPRSTRR